MNKNNKMMKYKILKMKVNKIAKKNNRMKKIQMINKIRLKKMIMKMNRNKPKKIDIGGKGNQLNLHLNLRAKKKQILANR